MTMMLIACSVMLLLMTARSACADENYSQDIASEIRGFLLDDDWKFDFDDDRGIFRFGVNIDGKMKHVNYFVPVRDDSYTVYAISPVSADSDDPQVMNAITEFICRANYGLRNGNFEIDMRDGEIRYKVFVDCDGGSIPTRDVIRGSIIIPAMMFERYSPGLLDVIFKGSNAAEAIEQCEN
ncbi:MAG: hypothetical protein IJS28_11665 [Synergistaceae bacterium]|nr:hypothetical protein [Synergistaceae bacterium]